MKYLLLALHSNKDQATQPDTIRSSFKKTGLVPYNPQEVLSKLIVEASDDSDTSSISSATNPFIQTTPRKIHDFESYANLLVQNVQDAGETTILMVSKFTEAALELAHVGAQARGSCLDSGCEESSYAPSKSISSSRE